MKYIILFILIPCILSAGLFDSAYRKSIKNLSKEELIDLNCEWHKKDIQFNKDYQVLFRHDNKVLDAYNQITKRPVVLRNIHFSVSAGLSAILREDNLLKSNVDFYISSSFYYKYMKYSVSYQPINRNIILSLGLFF